MNDERERLISDDSNEVKRIREKRLRELIYHQEKNREMSAKPSHVTDSDFNETITRNPLALIDFWASWCGPCQALAPTIEKLAQEYSGKVFVGKLDVDENPATAERFQVYSIPTVLIMKNGREVDRVVGCVPKEYIEAALRKHLGQ